MVSAAHDFKNNEMTYLVTIHSLLFCVRKPGERFALKYGLSAGINSPNQSTRSRSDQIVVVVNSSYAGPWQTADTILPLCQN